MQELTTTIKRNGVLIHGENGKANKTISHQDYIDGLTNLFDNNSSNEPDNEQEASKHPFLLPPNCYLFYPGKKTTEVGLFYRERSVPRMEHLYDGKRTKLDNMRLPNIVISIRLKAANDPRNKDIAFSLGQVLFFATDKGPLSLPGRLVTAPLNREHIWALPLPNMYPEGRMCYGHNSVLSTYTKDLRALHSLYRMIHESPFNNDLQVPSLREGHRPLDWLKKLHEEGTEKYPYQLLAGFDQTQHEKNQAEFKYAATNME